MNRLYHPLFWCLGCLLRMATAYGQGTDASISGQVTENTVLPLPAATVTVDRFDPATQSYACKVNTNYGQHRRRSRRFRGGGAPARLPGVPQRPGRCTGRTGRRPFGFYHQPQRP